MPANGERTEKATSRRRKQARDKGQFAYSQELTSALTLAVTLTAAFFTLRSTMRFRALMQSLLDVAIRGPQSEKVVYELIRESGTSFLMIATPILAAAFCASLAGSVIQGLPRPSPEAVVFKWDQLSPVRGFSKLKAKF
jgi:flagellar biosynthetic protein FlhB